MQFIIVFLVVINSTTSSCKSDCQNKSFSWGIAPLPDPRSVWVAVMLCSASYHHTSLCSSDHFEGLMGRKGRRKRRGRECSLWIVRGRGIEEAENAPWNDPWIYTGKVLSDSQLFSTKGVIMLASGGTAGSRLPKWELGKPDLILLGQM